MQRAAGFTLVEVLVALAIFAVIAVAGGAILVQTLGQQDASAERAETLRAVQLMRATLKADLAQAEDRPVRGPYGELLPTGFTGGAPRDDDVIARFVRRGFANPGGLEPRASLQLVEYVVEDGALYRRIRPRLNPTPDTPVSSRALISGVTNLRVSLFAANRWAEGVAANDGRGMPRAVAFEMEVAGVGVIRQAFLVAGASG